MKPIYPILLLLLSAHGYAQPLFTYGAKPVSSGEFLAAFHKSEGTSSTNYRDYLELYARYKLKVQAALDARLDTLAEQKKELADYTPQLVESYTGADSMYQRLARVEFERSQKDILMDMILIQVPYGSPADSIVSARKRIEQAYAALQRGQSFDKVALQYSGDPSVEANKGRVGFVTAFVLPYEIETVLYSTPKGQYSKPFQTKSGWLIVRHAENRKAAGQVVVSQILIGYPAEDGPEGRLRASGVADSLYQLVKGGADFKELSKQFSQDLFSYQDGGLLPAFGPGTYTSDFEAQAFALKSPGDISKPFETLNGFHILKLEKGIAPFGTFDIAARDAIYQQLQQGDRADYVQRQVSAHLKNVLHFKEARVDRAKLIQYTALLTENPRAGSSLFRNTDVLFTLAGKPYTAVAFNKFIKEKVSLEDATGDLYERFQDKSIREAFGTYLQQTNPGFRQQLKEFGEANLLFMMMQRKVWSAATNDEKGLQDFFARHASHYKWENSADAVIFTATDEKVAEEFRKLLAQTPDAWRELVASNAGIQADSGRYELSQIPVADRTNFSEKLITSNQHIENEPTVNFAYVIRLYPAGEQKKFEDARGQLISDYQNELEDQWIVSLKKKYPVKINESVFAKLPVKQAP